MAAHQGRGLCRTHYQACQQDGTLLDYETTSVPRHIVLEEWRMHADRHRTDRENIALLAPRLGMTVHALEQAVVRLHNDGILGAA